MRRRDHEDDAGGVVDLVEETPGTDTYPPSWGRPIAQASDVCAVMWVLAECRVDNAAELLRHAGLAASS